MYCYGMWWWLNCGYIFVGVEVWNCIWVFDYFEIWSEVDLDCMGVIGCSGGGVYSWWIVVFDDCICCVVFVVGIVDFMNYVFDGCVEGYCDCMFFVNIYWWDFV